MSMLLGQSVLPWWLVVPVTALVMMVVAGHLIALQYADMPASRRRIRTANGFLMLVAAPLFAFALTVSHRHMPDQFVLVWFATLAILGMVILLGCLDILNNMRLASRARGSAVRLAAEAMAADIARRRDAAASPAQTQQPPHRDHPPGAPRA